MKKQFVYILSILCFSFSLIIIISDYILIKNTPIKYNDLKKRNIEPLATSSLINDNNHLQNRIDTHDYKSEEASLHSFQEINPDLAGWITISNTNIDYPVVKTDNNDYYLNHDFWGNYSPCGTPFIDFSTDHSCFNFIIYGHNMKNGSMFSDLHNYKSYNFFKENSIIKFQTLNEYKYYKIVSILLINISDFDLSTFTYFPNEQSKKSFIQTITNKSIFDIDDTITTNNNFITLCTCDSSDDTRLFVIGREI